MAEDNIKPLFCNFKYHLTNVYVGVMQFIKNVKYILSNYCPLLLSELMNCAYIE